MKKARFYTDFCFAAGDDGICKRYWFEIEFDDDEYEELYQVWFANGSRLNNWGSNFEGHEQLFERLEATAYHALNDLLKKYEPELADPVEVYWQISEETEKEF